MNVVAPTVLIVQWSFTLVTLAVIASIFRFTALNSFVDHRKNALRAQLRERIAVIPRLLVVIQHIGKFAELREKERQVFEFLGDGYYTFASEIYQIRAQYRNLIIRTRFLLVGFLAVLFVLWIWPNYLSRTPAPLDWIGLVLFLFLAATSIAIILRNVDMGVATFADRKELESVLDDVIKVSVNHLDV